MTVRRAKFGDIPQLTAIMVAGHARSKYAAICGIDLAATKALFVQLLNHDKLKARGGACLFVSERAGVIDGFIAGLIDRLYLVGEKLAAQDIFFLVDGAEPRAAGKLLVAFIGWAEACPNVVSISVSATDIIGKPHRVQKLFERKGFSRSGVIYERKRA